ncbi:MAG: hypothetical protein HQ475_06700, partial [SAR202 cluster bacterium]|nr:hypothetical protein [SAR202 cluster bacterium]
MAEPSSRWPFRNEQSGTVVDLAVYALLPLVLLGILLAGLIASGVLPLTPSRDGGAVLEAFFLGPVGVVITGKDATELRSQDGRVTVAIPAGFVTTPVLLRYRETGVSGTRPLPQNYLSAGWFFNLSAQPVKAGNGPVKFQQKLSIAIDIGPEDLAMAENDYSRFAIQHLHDGEPAWVVLETIADPFAATVTAKVDSLSRFALTIGPAANEPPTPSQLAQVLPVATKTPPPAPTLIPTPAPTPAPPAAPHPQAPLTPMPVATAPPVPTPT